MPAVPVILAVVLISILPSSGLSGEPKAEASIEVLRTKVAALEQEAAGLEEQNQGLRQMLKEQEDNEVYIVVDTENNRLTLS